MLTLGMATVADYLINKEIFMSTTFLAYVFFVAFVCAIAYRFVVNKSADNKGTKPSTGGRPINPKENY